LSKFIRAAQTSQTLSLAAMEEASRLGLREADIEHLFLALVISDQSAGRALRSSGISLDAARRAVGEQHEAQLASLGIEASFPEAGPIVFHDTDGYQWSERASELLGRSGGKDKDGDAAAVLRELVAEPSGLIADILHRLDTTPTALIGLLDRLDSPGGTTATAAAPQKGRISGSTETFVPAPIDDVWTFLADPAHIPDWEMSVGTIEHTGNDTTPGMTWRGQARTRHSDGKPMKLKPQFRRRSIELATADRPERVEWQFGYPDAPQSRSAVTEFRVAATTGGTQVTITKSWSRRGGWRMLVGLPLRPVQKFFVWIDLFQTGSAISRAFR
jgi:uncharacterized protein YndB with AHSA1/START domain